MAKAFALERRDYLRTDNVIIALLSFSAVLFGYLALKPGKIGFDEERGEAIAVLEEQANTVKRKHVGSLVFALAEKGGELYDGDQLFTEAGSEATVAFGNGDKIQISENSLVKIETKGEKTTLDLAKGVLAGRGDFDIKLGNTKVSLTHGAEVQIKVDANRPDAARIALVSGEAEVAAGGRQVKLASDQVLSVDGAGKAEVKRLGVALIEPKRDARLVKGEGPTRFRWEPKGSFAAFTLVVAKDAAFTDVVTSRNVGGRRSAAIDLEPGAYYWKVQALTADGSIEESLDGTFKVVAPAAPVPLAPVDHAPYRLENLSEKSRAVVFLWKADGGSDFHIQVAKDRSFGTPLIDQAVSETSFTARFAEGSYFWRVRENLGGEKASPWSALGSFRVEEPEPLAAPPPASPEVDGTLPVEPFEPAVPKKLPPPELEDRYYFRLEPPASETASLGTRLFRWVLARTSLGRFAVSEEALAQAPKAARAVVEIDWVPVEGASAYRIELARDAAFREVVVRREVKEPRFSWPGAKPGRYFLRAASLSAAKVEGPYSPTSTVVVNYRAPYLYKPDNGKSVVLSVKSPSIGFRWQRVPALEFHFQVARDSDFKDVIVQRRLKSGILDFGELLAGTYYWRVGATYAKGLPIEWSNARQLTVEIETLDAPELLSPTSNEILAAEGETHEVDFAWQGVANAFGYEIEVAHGSKLGTVALKERLKETSLKAALAPGAYVFRVRTVGRGMTRGAWSPWRSFEVRRTLAAPSFTKPAVGEVFRYLKELPSIELAWTEVAGAASYVLELASEDGFEKPLTERSLTEVSASLELGAGSYLARVRAVDEDGIAGVFSEVIEFDVEAQAVSAPELASPGDGSSFPKVSRVRLAWTPEEGFTGYRLVVARDPSFKKVVLSRELESKEQAVVRLPGDGEYYWYVEGKNETEKLAVKSEVWGFKVSPYTGAASERVRLLAAYAPSVITNGMESDRISNSLSVGVLNSFILEGQYWFNRPIGIEAAYHRKSTTLFEDAPSLEGTSDQEALAYVPQDFGLRGMYRHPFSYEPGAPELHVRYGYLYKTFYSYYPESRTAIGLREAVTHNLSLGVGGKLPIRGEKYLEAALNYNHPLSAAPLKLNGGSHILLDGGFYLKNDHRLMMGFGYCFGRGSYSIRDDEHQLSGTLTETSHSLFAALGYGF